MSKSTRGTAGIGFTGVVMALIVGLGGIPSAARDPFDDAQGSDGPRMVLASLRGGSGSGVPSFEGRAVSPGRAGSRICLIGDSHSVGAFGQRLMQHLKRALGLPGQSTAKTGASVAHFAGWRPAAGKGKPIVIVALGTNPAGSIGRSMDQYASKIAKAAGSGGTCIWIGPPNMRAFSKKELDNRYRMINQAAAQSCGSGPCCRVVDSRKISHPGKSGDGVHLGPAQAGQWGSAAAGQVEALLKGSH